MGSEARLELHGMAGADEASGADTLAALNRALPVRAKLVHVHRAIRAQLPFVARIAIAISDPGTGVLSTYLHSSGEDDLSLFEQGQPAEEVARIREHFAEDRGG